MIMFTTIYRELNVILTVDLSRQESCTWLLDMVIFNFLKFLFSTVRKKLSGGFVTDVYHLNDTDFSVY